MLYLLDYGAGNVQSLANSIKKLGFDFKWVKHPDDINTADKLLFPGVGAFGPAMESLRRQGYAEPLKEYIASGKPYMGICIGMQALFEGSLEAPNVPGLGVVPGTVGKFSSEEASGARKSVPQMGWNVAKVIKTTDGEHDENSVEYGFPSPEQAVAHYYFVHSYRVAFDPEKHASWALTTTQYGSEVFVSSIQKGNVFATQFHPEKSGRAGLEVLRAWLSRDGQSVGLTRLIADPHEVAKPAGSDGLTKRIVACLDVRSNDDGDLVVTKGESYDVREKQESPKVVTAGPSSGGNSGQVRNLGKPVELAQRYYLEGADEVTFLNITSFRSCPLKDQPMLSLLELAAATIFVPLTIGGGIKDTVDPDGTPRPAKEVADAYFRAGADKVSIGSEAVYAVEELLSRAGEGIYDPKRAPDSALSGATGIETISKGYGAQAVVVSIDPRRVYLAEGESAPEAHAPCVVEGLKGSEDEGKRWWYRCTVKGGREERDIDVVQLARGVEKLGAGEVLLNSIDRDGSNKGFDRQLIDLVRSSVNIPVIASSGAGNPTHFTDIFEPKPLKPLNLVNDDDGAGPPPPSSVEAALAAGIFHRKECTIQEVKDELLRKGFKIRSEVVDSGAGRIVRQA
ncbi:imidazole glycerol phosphate synthase HisHF [Violaceomyces palustris]|uniref:Imidazole glycerol phosphate synthase HisHF n=1 Tax=Violaceomyces palustris TaxID=1673888 RepID=A0ACD0P103_9BASI|nr:imidazole glycerol phosphate synthase HisHF [Violaceomyces palustris]